MLSIIGFSLIFTAVVNGQAKAPETLKVQGVGLDSTYAQVVKALGKPVKDGDPIDEGCIGAHEKFVDFAGASFYFMDGDSADRKTFEVKIFSVTSGKYSVSGIKVGDPEAAVKRILGTKFERSIDDDGFVAWSFEFSDAGDAPGFTTIKFRRGKVAEISVAAMVC